MKKVYIGHSREFDYEHELYAPLRTAKGLPQADLILPYESNSRANNTRDFYRELDLFIAEVSYPSTGLGIELAWAYDADVTIVCLARANARVSKSLYVLTDEIIRYQDETEMVKIIQQVINQKYANQR